MRSLLMALTILVVTSGAQAEAVKVWTGYALDDEDGAWNDFRFGVSRIAYFVAPASGPDSQIFEASDGASVAILLGAMMNGTAEIFTWHTDAMEYMMPENYFFVPTRTPNPLSGYAPTLHPILAGRTDLDGLLLDHILFERTHDGSQGFDVRR